MIAYGKIFPVALYKPYHSSCVRVISPAAQISCILSAFVVPAIACLNAGWRNIHANAIAVGDTPYTSASLFNSAFKTGNLGFPMTTPPKNPYCKGDQACNAILRNLQYSIASPARVTDSSLYIFTLKPASTGAVCPKENWI